MRARSALAFILAAVLSAASTASAAPMTRGWSETVDVLIRTLPELPAQMPTPPAVPVEASGRMCSMSELFAKPLIIGASVSADFKAPSPGLKLARKYGAGAGVVKYAHPGAYGEEELYKIPDSAFDAASIVVGVDFFFWDGTQKDCAWGLQAVDALFAKVRSGRKPLVLGDIPGMSSQWYDGLFRIPPMTSCRDQLNARIKASCEAYSVCYLLDLATIIPEARRSGAELDGRRYSFQDLFADRLHPNEAGSELLARKIASVITQDGARRSAACAPR